MEAYGHRWALSPLNGHVPRRALLLHTPPRSMKTALTPGGQQTHTPASEAVAGHLRDASTQYMDAVFSRETMPAVDRLGDGRERAVVTFFQWETRLGPRRMSMRSLRTASGKVTYRPAVDATQPARPAVLGRRGKSHAPQPTRSLSAQTSVCKRAS